MSSTEERAKRKWVLARTSSQLSNMILYGEGTWYQRANILVKALKIAKSKGRTRAFIEDYEEAII